MKPQNGKSNPNWRGGKTTTKPGYIYLRMPNHPDANQNGYIRENRYVMEKHLGRRLMADEHVHHKNEIKTDNRIENLELISPSAHIILHKTKRTKCSVCERKHKAKGYCKSHYMKYVAIPKKIKGQN